jgi:hypothetical protein
MPDPWKWFTKDINEYYKKCQLIFNSTCNENIIYKLGPMNNSYNILELIDEFSNDVKDIFDNSPNNINPNEITNYNGLKIKYKSSDKKNIIAKYIIGLNDKYYDYIKNISLKVIRILEKDLNVYLNPYNYVLYRNLKIENSLIKNINFGIGSWVFHCDHDPPFKIKVFIYLNDIDENKAPFEIIYHPEKKMYPKMIPYGKNEWSWGLTNINYNQKLSDPYFLKNNFSNVYLINPNTRIPDKTLQQLKNDGFIKKKIIGKKGTMFACQTGLVHKANIGIDGYRDILVLECVPSSYKIDETNYKIQNMDTIEFYKNLLESSI